MVKAKVYLEVPSFFVGQAFQNVPDKYSYGTKERTTTAEEIP
jgi:hypothetical protein